MPDTQAFHDFEQAGWERAAGPYHDAWGALTAQAAGPLLDAARVGPLTTTLDVACGPGYVSKAAVGRDARVIAVDFAPAMVELARRNVPGLLVQAGDAEALAFPDHFFDAVVMNFGLLHLARPELAIEEAFRVLAPGGRFGFSVWASPAQARGFGVVLGAVERHGRTDVPLPAGPPFFRFSDPDESTHVLESAGFADVEVTRHPMSWAVPSAEQFVEIMRTATVRTAALLAAQAPAALIEIRRAIIAACESFRAPDHQLEFPMPAVIASGSKP
jgi:SAM-dependent methyltransferase